MEKLPGPHLVSAYSKSPLVGGSTVVKAQMLQPTPPSPFQYKNDQNRAAKQA